MLARTRGYAHVEAEVEQALADLKHDLGTLGLRPVLVGGTSDGKVLFRSHCASLDRAVVDAVRNVLGEDVEFMYDGSARELRLKAVFRAERPGAIPWWRWTLEAALVVAVVAALIARRVR